MKKAKKILALALCAVLLVGATIAGTVAYLTDTDNVVTNTIAVGKVEISLDETAVDGYGVALENTDRRTTNSYTLVPDKTYVKDPTVHVKNDSEPSYIFVKVGNEISDIEDATTIAEQITKKGWTQLTDSNGTAVAGVYYKDWTKAANAAGDYTDLVVFDNFKIQSDVDATTLNDYAGKTITVTAYAIQKSGFENNVYGAWEAVSAAAN